MSDDLDPQLKELFAAEKDEPPPEETKKRLAGALATTLALPVPTAALTTATHLLPVAKGMVTAAKAWAMTGAAFVAGGTAVVVWTTAQTSPVPMPVVPSTPSAVISASATPPAPRNRLEVPPVDNVVESPDGEDAGTTARVLGVQQDAATPVRTPVPSASGAASAPANGISAERALLDDARQAVNAGDYAQALRILDRHARQFPSGELWEEQEALAIDALVHTHDYAQAQSRADRLRKRSPHSLLLPMIDAELGSIP